MLYKPSLFLLVTYLCGIALGAPADLVENGAEHTVDIEEEDRTLQASKRFAKAKSFALCIGNKPYFDAFEEEREVFVDGVQDTERTIYLSTRMVAVGDLYSCDDTRFAKPLGKFQMTCNYNLDLLMTNSEPFRGSLNGPTLVMCDAAISIDEVKPNAKNKYLSTVYASGTFDLDDFIDTTPSSLDYQGFFSSTLPFQSTKVVGATGLFPSPEKFNTIEIANLKFDGFKLLTGKVTVNYLPTYKGYDPSA